MTRQPRVENFSPTVIIALVHLREFLLWNDIFVARFYLDANRQREPSSNYARRLQAFEEGINFEKRKRIIDKISARINFPKQFHLLQNILHQVVFGKLIKELLYFSCRGKTNLSEKLFRAKIFRFHFHPDRYGYFKVDERWNNSWNNSITRRVQEDF